MSKSFVMRDVAIKKPIITIQRDEDNWGEVVIGMTADELSELHAGNHYPDIPQSNFARIALEILNLRAENAELRAETERLHKSIDSLLGW